MRVIVALGWVLTTVLLTSGLARGADDNALFVHLNHYPQNGSANLIISPCVNPDEVAECVSHILECTKDAPNVLEIRIINGPVEETAKQLIEGTNGSTSGMFVFAKGKMNAILAVQSVSMIPNDMDGIWSLSVNLGFPPQVMVALTNASVEGASIALGKNNFLIVPSSNDSDEFLAFKDNCAALWEDAG
jgi:hypothetical protein